MAGKKSPSIFSTLQKTTENASAVNGELTRQLPVASLVDNPMNRFSMAEDDEFLSTMRSVEQDGFLEDIVVTPDGENTWRIISGHRRVMAAELPPPPPKPAPAANPLRTVDSFGRAVRRSTAQLKALDLSADVDRTTARKKLDTCLANLEELRRTVEALNNGNGTRVRPVTVILAVFSPTRKSFLQRPQGAYHANFC